MPTVNHLTKTDSLLTSLFSFERKVQLFPLNSQMSSLVFPVATDDIASVSKIAIFEVGTLGNEQFKYY